MKHLVAALVCLLAMGQSRAEDDPNYVYSVSFAQGFAVTRYAKPEYADKLRSARPNCVLVRWVYAPKDEIDLDNVKAERERSADAVNTELNNRPEVAVAAITVGGVSGLWVLYTASGDDLAKALDARLSELRQSKYQVRLISDAEWSLYGRHVEQLREKK